MEPLTGNQAVARVRGILNPKYQVHAYWVDLTVRSISGVLPVGKLDYGGGEYTPAGRVTLTAKRLRSEDNYLWWELKRGCYVIEFNETLALAENEFALLEPDPRTLRTGAWHVPVYLRGQVAPMDMLFDVQALRLLVKENARVSRLRVFRIGPDITNDAPISLPAEKRKAPKTSNKRRKRKAA